MGIAVLALIAAAGGYLIQQHVARLLTGSGCQVAGSTSVPLTPGQAAIAATIAGVAHQRAMPDHAVVIAYATALQESHLRNLHYGDRDSVGVFQQRPSQGWGPRRKLEDPVYAATRFFEALAAVPGYRDMPVYRAAQAVQHSADGYAYEQYQQMAQVLTAAFTGRRAHAVWCWRAAEPGGHAPDLAAAGRELAATFGLAPQRLVASPGETAGMAVPAPSRALGWAVAAWLVTHAAGYGLHRVDYDGMTWRASAGQAGWKSAGRAADPGEVQAG